MATCTFTQPPSIEYLPCGRKLFKLYDPATGKQKLRVVHPGMYYDTPKRFDPLTPEFYTPQLRGAGFWKPLDTNVPRPTESSPRAIRLTPRRGDRIELPLQKCVVDKSFWRTVEDDDFAANDRLETELRNAEVATKAAVESATKAAVEAEEAAERAATETAAEIVKMTMAVEVTKMTATVETAALKVAMAPALEPTHDELAVESAEKAWQEPDKDLPLDLLPVSDDPKAQHEPREQLDIALKEVDVGQQREVEVADGADDAGAGEAGTVTDYPSRPDAHRKTTLDLLSISIVDPQPSSPSDKDRADAGNAGTAARHAAKESWT
ncbi:hypothetical protein OBBRIDRAFT_838448 [Obba rivulosa]|uniref:Uncharacterized protein n=1 Tax=Obba rivulosa TaxID=1052685 RepID=A0A8E2APM7_9APHY|nr:hypothetical protein OBBRIDRAFT_838448 [Obba rivulosa]